jgi:5'-nucleotidase (lipoprotein e(P4) family)
VKRAAVALLIVALAPAVTGCAARQQFLERVRAQKAAVRGDAAQADAAASGAAAEGVQLTTLTELPPPDGTTVSRPMPAPAPAAATARGRAVPPGMQFLYGSGEAVALDMQAYMLLNDLMFARSGSAQVGHDEKSAVLAPGATLDKPVYLPCGDKPLAVVFDVDETALLNLGYEANEATTGQPYSAERWDRWEKFGADAVAAMPGMLEAKAVANASHVTFVYNTNRSAANAAATEKALNNAGIGPAVHGETLWLQGDEGGGSGKDARRWAIAKKYCVIALVGDQLGDFSDLFNAPGVTPADRRALAGGRAIKTMWGHGWFVLPNPVYGTALKGGMDDVFPADKRWHDPAGPIGGSK